jgi:hypothetical protein
MRIRVRVRDTVRVRDRDRVKVRVRDRVKVRVRVGVRQKEGRRHGIEGRAAHRQSTEGQNLA